MHQQSKDISRPVLVFHSTTFSKRMFVPTSPLVPFLSKCTFHGFVDANIKWLKNGSHSTGNKSQFTIVTFQHILYGTCNCPKPTNCVCGYWDKIPTPVLTIPSYWIWPSNLFNEHILLFLFRIVFLLNITYGGNFVPSPNKSQFTVVTFQHILYVIQLMAPVTVQNQQTAFAGIGMMSPHKF